MRRSVLPLTCLAVALTAAGCGGTPPPAATTVTPTATTGTTTGTTAPAQAPSPPAPSATSSASPAASVSASDPTTTVTATVTATSSAPTSAPATPPAGSVPGSCSALAASMTRPQRVGQLLMVGLDSGWPTTQVDATVTKHAVGGVILLGGWTSNARVVEATSHLQPLATAASGHGVGALMAADQEGGQVQQLRELTPMPSALQQGRGTAASIQALGRRTGSELKRVGINLDLAPVADTVPPSIGRANQPIGRWGRQYGNDPATATKGVVAFTTGLREAGVGASVKHFPGLGRIRGNTDFTADGIDDPVTTRTDPYLQPFVQGWKQGAMVMVSSARYPRIDPANQAVFSRPIITDLLRGTLGYRGVVITDDVGNAKAVSAVSPGDRAVRFVAAGGDIVLTAVPDDIKAMKGALVARADADPAFAAQVDAATTRVLAYKAGLGLTTCR